jgi:hypothetical protein
MCAVCAMMSAVLFLLAKKSPELVKMEKQAADEYAHELGEEQEEN